MITHPDQPHPDQRSYMRAKRERQGRCPTHDRHLIHAGPYNDNYGRPLGKRWKCQVLSCEHRINVFLDDAVGKVLEANVKTTHAAQATQTHRFPVDAPNTSASPRSDPTAPDPGEPETPEQAAARYTPPPPEPKLSPDAMADALVAQLSDE